MGHTEFGLEKGDEVFDIQSVLSLRVGSAKEDGGGRHVVLE